MARTLLIIWTFIAAAITFNAGIWVALAPEGSIGMGIAFALMGLVLGGDMAVDIHVRHPSPSHVSRPVAQRNTKPVKHKGRLHFRPSSFTGFSSIPVSIPRK
jgi:hypothetical protein